MFKGRGHFAELCVDERITIKWISKKQGVRMWIRQN
jgi:hypothetical protein